MNATQWNKRYSVGTQIDYDRLDGPRDSGYTEGLADEDDTLVVSNFMGKFRIKLSQVSAILSNSAVLGSEADEMIRELNDLYASRRSLGFVEVDTPYEYDRGECVKVYCRRVGSSIVIMDKGDTTRWCKKHSVTMIPRVVDFFCEKMDVKFDLGVISEKRPSVQTLTYAVTRVASTAASIANICALEAMEEV